MEFEYWWLLAFPLFFVLGWLAARIDLRQLLSESRALPARYFMGLKHLLNDEHDQAIAAFEEVVKANPQAPDLNFALGVLFRRKGELEKAIRMHQGLLDREDISKEVKLEARFELGRDYHKVGLFDRAEQQYQELRGTALDKKALAALLEVSQQERNWHQAIEMANQLADAGAIQQHEVAQFYCELAQREINHSHISVARDLLEKALAVHRRCIRARMMLGDLAQNEGELQVAITYWQGIEEQDVNFLPLVAKRLLAAYHGLNRADEGRQYLQSLLTSQPQLDMLETVFEAIVSVEGQAVAAAFLRQHVLANPNWPGIDKLLDVRSTEAEEPLRSELLQIRKLLQNEARQQSLYHCSACGFRAKNHYWHCPACQGWETINPYRGTENPH